MNLCIYILANANDEHAHFVIISYICIYMRCCQKASESDPETDTNTLTETCNFCNPCTFCSFDNRVEAYTSNSDQNDFLI